MFLLGIGFRFFCSKPFVFLHSHVYLVVFLALPHFYRLREYWSKVKKVNNVTRKNHSAYDDLDVSDSCSSNNYENLMHE